ncbi:MAG: 2-oxo acid dehydrogenase subunit E2 [Oscillospiraceae bacterium]|nr:2-oxo acid dehydrogenase subunit E2 [Oscillospiraceae bacterium]
MSRKREHFGDRPDGVLLRDLDSLHYITGIIYPNRCDNEAFISETIDLTNINKFLEKKNAEDPVYKYNLFQIIVTAVLKTITLRPKMNRFIVNGNFYQRKEVSASFVVKKEFDDKGGEALAFIHSKGDDTLDSIHQSIYDQISFCRSDSVDSSTENMDILNKIPRVASKAAVKFIMFLDKHGRVPHDMIATDPYYSSVVLSNLGSIKLKSGYHHLTNWGTCSVICLIGEVKETPVFQSDGSIEMKPTVDLGITLDERLADGYYYSKTVRLLKHLLENPELLELPLNEETEY